MTEFQPPSLTFRLADLTPRERDLLKEAQQTGEELQFRMTPDGISLSRPFISKDEDILVRPAKESFRDTWDKANKEQDQ